MQVPVLVDRALWRPRRGVAPLLRARHTYLHIVGAAKHAVLERASEPGDAEQLPIRAVLLNDAIALDIYYAQRN